MCEKVSNFDDDDIDYRPYSEIKKHVDKVNKKSGKKLLTIRKAKPKGYRICLTNEWKKDFNEQQFLRNFREDT